MTRRLSKGKSANRYRGARGSSSRRFRGSSSRRFRGSRRASRKHGRSPKGGGARYRAAETEAPPTASSSGSKAQLHASRFNAVCEKLGVPRLTTSHATWAACSSIIIDHLYEHVALKGELPSPAPATPGTKTPRMRAMAISDTPDFLKGRFTPNTKDDEDMESFLSRVSKELFQDNAELDQKAKALEQENTELRRSVRNTAKPDRFVAKF
jgi:hypothetical protein